MQLQHVRIERIDDVEQHLIVRIDRERDLGGAALHTLAERARSLEADVTGLGGKKTKPTRLAPESSATSSACEVLRPQILIDRGIMRRVLPPYHPAAKQNVPVKEVAAG